MDKKEIFKKIIIEAQKLKPDLTRRDFAFPHGAGKVIALYGPRRVGKTYLFYQTIKNLLAKGEHCEKIIYINFEDERIAPFLVEDWEILMDAYFELYPEHVDKKIYLFFDEVQETPLWEKFVRRLSEKKVFQVFITGSSSKLLSKEISTTLRGRTLSYFIMPFSFKEFLRHKGIKPDTHIEYSPARHKIKKLFQEYMYFGGFPEIFDKENSLKIEILQSYFDLTFYKDIVERYKIRNFNIMRDLMRYLISHFSTLLSITNYYNILKSSNKKIGKETIFEYISWLEDVNFIKAVPIFDYSIKKQQVNSKKIYSIDTGLVSAASFQFSENRGRYLENLVFLELLRRNEEIYYYKDSKGNEIDFLTTKHGKPVKIIQVAQNIDNFKIKNRELRPLVETANKFNINKCLILTEESKKEFTYKGLKINVMPIWRWLMDEN